MPEASTMSFAIYYLHYKKKLGIIKSTIKLVTNSAASLLTQNSGICAAQLGLVAKNREPLRTFVYFLYRFQTRSLYFSLIFSKIYLTILKCTPIFTWQLRFKCTPIMSKWQFNSTLASFFLLADYTSIKLTSGVCLNLFLVAQTIRANS